MDSLPKGASLTPTFHLGNELIFDEIEENTYLDDYTKEVLHEYNDADLFVDWLSPAQLEKLLSLLVTPHIQKLMFITQRKLLKTR